MHSRTRTKRGLITRSAVGPTAAEAFVLIAIATILFTRTYLRLTGYPQIGGGNLHIAHALWGGALMMLALVTGWMVLGFGARVVCVVLGGVGFGLFLDEVGKFVTKDNDYFYGPAAEIMYILVVLILIGARVVRGFRPLNARECLSSAASIAADGVARGLADHRRDLGLALLQHACDQGSDPAETEHIRALLLGAGRAPDRLYRLQRWLPRLIPDFFRSPRWVPVVGWLLVAGAVAGVVFGALGVALGGYLYDGDNVTLEFAGANLASVILLVSAALTAAMAVPAMIARRRTDSVWPLRWLRNAALTFTFLNALVDFATEGFGALVNLSIGLFTLAVLSYQLDRAVVARSTAPLADEPAESTVTAAR
ncbi:hypothetical protein M2272_000218 [Mycobacterium frederiksbergense]|uniref:Uncharacterized protein n=1 Tax=Mycolicibacterium frederiksbergense TaxID=117567 RepID=A0ABT6KS79_9MYCO|nr:hypothetical protein [Mycolicibacterium frederiksbergense]MDH6193597.1 hypothetical protein [Mycolicibacterium frederiksbergense]